MTPMNSSALYDVLQNILETAPHFFGHGNGHHVRVDVRYFTGASFSAHCHNTKGLETLLHMLLAAYRGPHTEHHLTHVDLAWVYADES